jgi:hypothetical protein
MLHSTSILLIQLTNRGEQVLTGVWASQHKVKQLMICSSLKTVMCNVIEMPWDAVYRAVEDTPTHSGIEGCLGLEIKICKGQPMNSKKRLGARKIAGKLRPQCNALQYRIRGLRRSCRHGYESEVLLVICYDAFTQLSQVHAEINTYLRDPTAATPKLDALSVEYDFMDYIYSAKNRATEETIECISTGVLRFKTTFGQLRPIDLKMHAPGSDSLQASGVKHMKAKFAKLALKAQQPSGEQAQRPSHAKRVRRQSLKAAEAAEATAADSDGEN